MTNEERRAAYSQFRLDYNDYLNSEVPVDEKEDLFEPPVGVNIIWASGSSDFLGQDDRRYFTFLGD
jgi:hypothetical protein